MKPRTLLPLCALAALLPAFAVAQRLPGDNTRRPAGSTSGDPVISNCRVDLVDDIRLPAVDAGVLLFLGVKEGDQVRSEQEIARVDDREPQQEHRRATIAYRRAYKQATNPISANFAKAQLKVAEANVQTLKDANKGGIQAVTKQEMREAELEARSGVLRVENAEHELDLAKDDAAAASVEVDSAQMLIDRRVIRAPFEGEVLEVFKKQSEWVSPGDPVLRLIRLDTLYVEGLIDADRYSFADLKGCEVTVEVRVAGGRPEQATGRVVWVDPILMQSVDGKVAKVRAEIANRREQGEWVIQPNRSAEMTVHLGTGGVTAARRIEGRGARGE